MLGRLTCNVLALTSWSSQLSLLSTGITDMVHNAWWVTFFLKFVQWKAKKGEQKDPKDEQKDLKDERKDQKDEQKDQHRLQTEGYITLLQ